MRREELNLSDPPGYDRPGDSWMCGDTEHTCANGPSRNGKCPLAEACQPKRTWFGRRRIGIFATLAAAVFVLAYALRPSVAPTVFKPGELTTPHSQILAGQLTSARCAACHQSASISPLEWFNSDHEAHRDVGQTDRCLDCHHRTIKPDVAKMAHNLPTQVRADIQSRIRLTSATSEQSWHDMLPEPSVDQNNVECAACHREHRGPNADLLAISDHQCQTCHENRFGSFATSHPDWTQWPYGRGGDIAFNHSTHLTKHFPSTLNGSKPAEFRCNQCHKLDEHGELSRSVNYETGCKSCHDEAIRVESAKGFDLVALPTIPEELAAEIGDWPENATGFLEGDTTPFVSLLLRGTTPSLTRADTKGLAQLDTESKADAQYVLEVAKQHRDLLTSLATLGQPEFERRGAKSGLTPTTIRNLFGTLPPQLLSDSLRTWFKGDNGSPLAKSDNLRVTEERGMVRQVDFTDEVQASGPQPEPSLLLPLSSSEEILLGPRIAQRPDRPLRKSRSTSLGYADDAALLGQAPKFSLKGTISNSQSKNVIESNRVNTLSKNRVDIIAPERGKNTKSDLSNSGDSLSNSLQPKAMISPEKVDGDEMEDSLAESTLVDDAIASDALTDEPLTDDLLTNESLSSDPLADDSLMDDPLAEDPLAGDPLTDDPLAEDPLMDDPLSEDPLADDPLGQPGLKQAPNSTPKRFEAGELIPQGGWYRDDLRLAISYRGGGHSDPVLRAAVELLWQLPAHDPVRSKLLSNQALSSCMTCHTNGPKRATDWKPATLLGDKSEFTKFSHGPHMNIAKLSDCRQCHQVRTSPNAKEDPISLVAYLQPTSETTSETIPNHEEFLPLNRQACASCHTAKAAGDSCTKCHRYHIQQ